MIYIFEILKGSIANGSHIIALVSDQPEGENSTYTESKHALLHNQNVFMNEGQKFITTSEKIVRGSSTGMVDKIILHFGKMVDVSGKVKITLKSKRTQEIYGIKYISNTSIDKVIFDITTCVSHIIPDTDILNNKLQIEIETLCENIEPCCDKLPSNMTLIPNSISFCTDCDITPSITTTTSTTSSTTTTNPPSQQEQLPSPQIATFALSSQPCGGIYFPDNSPSINIIENIAYRQYKFDPSTSLQVVYYIIEIGYYGNSTNNTPSWISVVPPQVYNNSEQNINLCGYFPISGAGFYQIRVKIRISSGILADSDYVFSDFISIPIQ